MQMDRPQRGRRVHVFPVDRPGAPDVVVFSTRPETVCGASYVVVGPEWPGLHAIVVPDRKPDVDAHVEAAARKSDREPTGDGPKADKTGVWTGAYAQLVQPATAWSISIVNRGK